MADVLLRLASSGIVSANDSFEKLTDTFKQLGREVGKMSGGFVDFSSKIVPTFDLSSVVTGTISAARAGISAMTDLASSLTSTFADTSSKFEQIGVRFETLFGTGGPADAALKWARDFGARTPFTLDEVTNRMIKLKSAGFDPLDDSLGVMQKLGDTTLALGIDFERILNPLRKLNSGGKATFESINQLAEAGIPIYDLLNDRLGMTAEQVQNIAKENIKGRDIVYEIIDALGDKYAGAMQRASDTAEGAMSTIKDLGTEVILAITDEGPWEEWRRFLVSTRDTLSEVLKTEDFKTAMSEIAGALTSVFAVAAGFGSTAIRWLAETVKLGGEIAGSQWWTEIKAIATLDVGKLQGNDVIAQARKTMDDYFTLRDEFNRRKVEEQGGPVADPVDAIADDTTRWLTVKEAQNMLRQGEFKEHDKRVKEWLKEQERLEKERLAYMKKVDAEARKLLKDRLRDELDAEQERMNKLKDDLQLRAKREEEFRDYQKKLADIAYSFEEERSMTAFKRMQEDRMTSLDRAAEDVFDAVDQWRQFASSGMGGSMTTILEGEARNLLDAMQDQGINPFSLSDRDMKRAKRFIEDIKRERQRAAEDEAKMLKKKQDEDRAKREYLQKQSDEIRKENTKRMIELATSIKNFKGKIEQRIKILDQGKFISGFMEDVFKRAGVIATAEGMKVAGA